MSWLFKCDWCGYTWDSKPIVVKVGRKGKEEVLTFCSEECLQKFKTYELRKGYWEWIKVLSLKIGKRTIEVEEKEV